MNLGKASGQITGAALTANPRPLQTDLMLGRRGQFEGVTFRNDER